jgi:hypothetical protein
MENVSFQDQTPLPYFDLPNKIEKYRERRRK